MRSALWLFFPRSEDPKPLFAGVDAWNPCAFHGLQQVHALSHVLVMYFLCL